MNTVGHQGQINASRRVMDHVQSRRDLAVLRRIALGLTGYESALEQALEHGLDGSIAKEDAAELAAELTHHTAWLARVTAQVADVLRDDHEEADQ